MKCDLLQFIFVNVDLKVSLLSKKKKKNLVPEDQP